MKCRRRRVFAAATALLLALMLPAAASAGARVSEEAVARWRSDWRFYQHFTEEDDEALLTAFEGEAFDGMTIESYTIRHFGVYAAAAVLRHEDGTLHAYTLTREGSEDWRVAEQTAALPQVAGVDRVHVQYSDGRPRSDGEYGEGLEIDLYRGEKRACVFKFDGEPGEMSLWSVYCPDGAFASAYVPALRNMRFDGVKWESVLGDGEDSQYVRVNVDAVVVYRHRVLSADAYMEPDAFAIPFQDADLGALLEKQGEVTQSGITFIDEAWMIDAREAAGLPLDVPAMPEPIDVPFALPEPVLASFEPGQHFEVYTGPGKDYVREENGCASLSTDDWVLVFGEEDGWLMIAYRVSDERVRFGWIEATQAQAGVSVPLLTWADEPIAVHDEVMNNPFYWGFFEDILTGSESADFPGTLLGVLGDMWAYVQTAMPDGTLVRGFLCFFDYRPQEDTIAFVNVSEGGSAPLYDAPGGEETGRLYPGTMVAVKEERDGKLYVICYMREGGHPSFDLSVRGWIDAGMVTRDYEGRWYNYYDQSGYSAMRVVMDADENAVPEDIAKHGGAYAYVLLAEIGDRAYLQGTDEKTGVTVPCSRLKETTRGVLCLPNGKEGGEVSLYWCEDGAEAVFTGEDGSVQVPPGTTVDVLMRAQGAALVCVHTNEKLDGTYWVDERYLVEGM